ncbi:hypothetical protein BG0461 [Borreliella bavariensis PBi]|uniref:Uncharacterized protein n=1 Tax=Borrelia garinii subsp. bavariensis (strain ATCC BAA-2496 / DSM 23469 / PBi) TaxID=290434 RepID=A0A7I6GWC5_BORGP|nr:hypothetical protein BG0461 [Borreliella bavariensis PBi]
MPILNKKMHITIIFVVELVPKVFTKFEETNEEKKTKKTI